MGLRLLRTPCLAVALLLAAAPGPAYVVNRTGAGAEQGWDLAASALNVVGGKVTFYVDTDGVQDVGAEAFAAAVRAAVESWDDVPDTAIGFLEDDTRPAGGRNAGDKVNRIGYQAGVLSPFVYAVAFRALSGAKCMDADVVLNPSPHVNDGTHGGQGTDLPWSTSTHGTENTADVQAVVTHEWGHCIGFDHVPLGRSTMYYAMPAGAIMLRSLETDDEAGLGHRYPGASFATARATIRGRVDVTGTTNDRGVQVTAIDFGTGRPAAAALSEPDGTYAIEGLPPGVYRVVASPLGTSKVSAGVYNDFWDSAATALVPAIRAGGGGLTEVIPLEAGGEAAGVDLSISSGSDPNEPDGTLAEATPIPVGGSLAGRIETDADVDLFSFPGTAGGKVSVYVHAQQIGSDLDPRVQVLNPAGIPIANNFDIRGGSDSFDEEGYDYDARVLDVTLPSTGTYYVRVTSDLPIDPSEREEDLFYVVTLIQGGGAASPYTSTLSASPAVIDADGTSTSTITFRPKTLTGTDSGPGLAVTMDLVEDAGAGDGSLGEVQDRGNGTYRALLTAPLAAGGDAVRARVALQAISAVNVTYRGPGDGVASGFSASPRRIRFDGASTSTVTLLPRDANWVDFGPGKSVTLSLEGDPAAGLGPTTDAGGGAYTATLTSGTREEVASVTATVEGDPLGASLEVGCGFPLEPVVDDALADVTAALAASPPAKALAKLQAAGGLLEGVDGLSSPDDDPLILDGVRKAVKALEAATRKGAPGLVPLEAELAEAAREAALAAVAAAEAADPADKATLKARTLFDAGEAFLADDLYAKASTKYRAALLQALKVLP